MGCGGEGGRKREVREEDGGGGENYGEEGYSSYFEAFRLPCPRT